MIDLFPHAEVVLDAVDAAFVERVRVERFERYTLVDRGSYEVAPFADDAVLAALCEIAGTRLGHTLAAIEARVVRLRAGDYVLARHDLVRLDRAREDQPVELVLDLSPVAVAAGVHYRRRGQVFFRVACVPRSLAIVERTPAVTCNHVYVSRRTPDVCVTRLVVLCRRRAT